MGCKQAKMALDTNVDKDDLLCAPAIDLRQALTEIVAGVEVKDKG
jgi:hypothetical protein